MAVPFRMPVDDNIKHLIKTVIMLLSQTRMEISDDTTGLLDYMDNLHGLLSSEFERRNRTSQKEFDLRDSLILLKCKLEEHYPNSRRSHLEGPQPSLCDDCKSAKIVKDEIDNQFELQQQLSEQCLHHHHHHHQNRVLDREQLSQPNSNQENTRKNEKTDDSAWWLPMSLRRSLWNVIPVLCVLGWHLLETNLCII